MPSPTVPPTTLSEQAYRQIRDMVLHGQVLPGEKLRLEPLAEKVGMGTTPLREALSRLATEGLVVGHGQRGYWAPGVSREEYEQITDLRLDLETKALAASIAAGSEDWEVEVLGAFHRLSRATAALASDAPVTPSEWERLNRGFHMALIGRCGNPWLLRFIGQLFDQSERYRHLGVSTRAVPLSANDAEHAALMRAALERRGDDAVTLLRAHIGESARKVMDRLFPRDTAARPHPQAGRTRTT